SGGSALGVSVVDAPEHLPHAMVSAFAYDDVVMVEEFVDGIEVAVSVVDFGSGPLALPAVEIDTDGAYDYDARYNGGRSDCFGPARPDETKLMSAERVSARAHEELGLRHYSRSDMRIPADGAAHGLEVNAAPGMREASLLPQA